jgi:hypothetical protein
MRIAKIALATACAFTALTLGASLAEAAKAKRHHRVRTHRVVHVATVAPPIVIAREPSELLAKVPVDLRDFGRQFPCTPQYQWVYRPGYGPYNGLFTSICTP